MGDTGQSVHAAPTGGPGVSVVIIFLNAGDFLDEAIASVFAQTFQNWELLLVDDGSTDSSSRIARMWVAREPRRVRYFEHADHGNLGMSASRNLGLQHARGEYVAFLDADDAWTPPTLEEQVALLTQHPDAAMIYGPIEWWFSWTGSGHDVVQQLGVEADTLHEPPGLLLKWLQLRAPSPSGMLLRRKAAERVGGFEECFAGLYEDQAFSAKICVRGAVFVSSHCWYKYRQHPGSACSTAKARGEYHTARPGFLAWLDHYLTEQEVQDPRVWRALRREQWRCRHPVAAHASTLAGRWLIRLARAPGQVLQFAGPKGRR
jgi:glycosyltransferase involved in cell wall biosynthesis